MQQQMGLLLHHSDSGPVQALKRLPIPALPHLPADHRHRRLGCRQSGGSVGEQQQGCQAGSTGQLLRPAHQPSQIRVLLLTPCPPVARFTAGPLRFPGTSTLDRQVRSLKTCLGACIAAFTTTAPRRWVAAPAGLLTQNALVALACMVAAAGAVLGAQRAGGIGETKIPAFPN